MAVGGREVRRQRCSRQSKNDFFGISTRKERQKMIFSNDFVFGPFDMKIIFDERKHEFFDPNKQFFSFFSRVLNKKLPILGKKEKRF